MATRSKKKEVPTQEPMEEVEYIVEEVREEVPEQLEEPVEVSETNEAPAEITLRSMLTTITKSYVGLPFDEPSFFETLHFDLGSELTPARAYLRLGKMMFYLLNIYSSERVTYLEKLQLSQQLRKDLETPANWSESEFQLKEARLDLVMVQLSELEIRLEEYLQRISYLYNEYVKFPAITREDLEKEEYEYHMHRLEQSDQSYTTNCFMNMLKNTQQMYKKVMELAVQKAKAKHMVE